MSAKKKTRTNKNTIILCIVLALLLAFGIYYLADKDGAMALVDSVLGPKESDVIADAPEKTQTPEKEPSSGAPAAVSGDPMDVYVLDVGQGDSLLFVSPSKKTMLIDASESKCFDGIDAFLKELGIEKLDVVIATHPHSDHIGAMKKVINAYDIGTFYMPSVTHTSATYEKMIDALDERNVKTVIAETDGSTLIAWDDAVEIKLLSPIKGEEYDDLNDWSIIARVKYGDTSIMTTGDAEFHAESLALEHFEASDFKSSVLKMGHHGSSTSTSREFFDAVDPDTCVISCGVDNDYGHPHQETLDLLEETNTPFYRTDEQGTIHIVLDGQEVSITTEK